MPHSPTPWLGLAALVAMFVIPFLPDWIFEGPRTTRHWPRRHICGDCGAPWSAGHTCEAEADPAASRLLRGELRRPARPRGRRQLAIPARTIVVPRLDETDPR
jgi:hypothetical protein